MLLGITLLGPNKHRWGIEWAHHHIIAAVIAPP